MKVTKDMAATLPDDNDLDEVMLTNHPAEKSSSRKSKVSVYRTQTKFA